MSHIVKVETKLFDDQTFGTSGIRKKVHVFEQEHYIENIIQSIFNALPKEQVTGSTWLISGDGRYYTTEAINRILRVFSGNQIGLIWIAENALISTPAASAVIRNRENGACYAAILLTASHNPGGRNHDFGIKLNTSNGAPANSNLTKKIEEELKKLKYYYCDVDAPHFDPSHHKKGDMFYIKHTTSLKEAVLHKFQKFIPKLADQSENSKAPKQHHTLCEIIDPIADWMLLIKQLFDFNLIKSFVQRKDVKILYDGLYGVGSIYGKYIFINELGLKEDALLHCEPRADFGGLHPDPNPIQAYELYKLMNCLDRFSVFDKCRYKKQIDTCGKSSNSYYFGAATDGDCDRAMILGNGVYISPCDSLAIITYYASKCTPYFKNKENFNGVARSMPTSSAVDLVAKKLKIPCYKVPTGWKFFSNLMDSNKINICGEESYGAGSTHLREKDGMWAILCWLSILAYKNEGKNLLSLQEIMEEFYREFGRVYYTRYDFEDLTDIQAKNIFEHLDNVMNQYKQDTNIFNNYSHLNNPTSFAYFDYTDPIDNTVLKNNGIEITKDDTRIVYRSSQTSADGVTLRLYIEKYEKTNTQSDPVEYLMDVYSEAIQICELTKYTNRDRPSVIA